MAVGLAGVILPAVPGLSLVLAAGLWWTIADGGGVRWAVFAIMVVLVAVGMVAQYVLPARATAGRGVPWWTLAVGALGAVIGFFVIPAFGVIIGGLGGIYLAELLRLRDARAALGTTWAAVKGIGIGVIVELTAGVLAALTWFIGALVF